MISNYVERNKEEGFKHVKIKLAFNILKSSKYEYL